MAVALPSRPSAALVVGALVAAYIFYVAAKGTLANYLAILFGTATQATTPTNTPAATAGTTGVSSAFVTAPDTGTNAFLGGNWSTLGSQAGQTIPISPLDAGSANQDFTGTVDAPLGFSIAN